MTRDPEKLKEYRKKYEEKLQRLGVKRLGIQTFTSRLKCPKCNLGFTPRDELYRKKGKIIQYYHQECWDKMQY